MTSLVLGGNTLGEKHKAFNEAVKAAIASKTTLDSSDFNIEECDVNNLLKIDKANSDRNIEYILEMLKSEDMLYVSRAIKRCAWLVTDKQYTHIINPHYLHTQLFPQMTSKASNKLVLHIRLHLKDETRVEEFYRYYREKNLLTALKWLPYCSLAVIEKEVEDHHDEIQCSLLGRLCERSITVLEIYIKKCERYILRDALKTTLFLINTDVEKYFKILDTVDKYSLPRFGKKHTEIIMLKRPQMILDSFDKYYDKIHTETFAKYMKTTDLKDFLLKQAQNKEMKSWFSYGNLKHFIKYIPKEGRFEFVKNTLIEKGVGIDNVEAVGYSRSECCNLAMQCSMKNFDIGLSSSANVYRWYRFAPFNVAFPEMKKLIRAESSPSERIAILEVLLHCACRNPQHLQILLQYFNDKHINEPFKFKIQFVNILLTQTATHKYDEKTWNMLNNIFYSMEVYIESDTNVQSCIKSIIQYKVLHDETVPDIIERKFIYSTLKDVQKKLNKQDNEKIFHYLYNNRVNKTQTKSMQTDATEIIQLLEDILTLLVDWKKELLDYPWVLNKIKELIEVKKTKKLNVNLLSLYNKNKSWRKHMFEESLVMSPTEEACLNALKHDPKLLTRYKSEVEALCRNDGISLGRLLSKMRIYWPQSLATEWTTAYLGRLEQPGGCKALIRGLINLLSKKELVNIVKKYAPTETKINWSEDEEVVLNLRKNIAKYMHFARPLPPPDLVLLYAHGDYLQYALQSLNSILYNISSVQSREHIRKLLNAPVSVQKHGIRLAFTKLESKELKKIFSDIWNSTKNTTIRAVLFKQTYDLLCREKNPSMVEEIWELLATFIDNLSFEENRVIYYKLGKVDKVPLAIRPRFCQKSYKYLKSLPAKANCEKILDVIVSYTRNIMEFLDSDFVLEMLKENLDRKFTTTTYDPVEIMSSYVLAVQDEESQCQRYERLLIPLLESSLVLWKVQVDGTYFVKANVNDLLKQISTDFQQYAFVKKMAFPVKMFTAIQNKLEEKLAIQENYVLLRSWKLRVTFLKCLEGYKSLFSTIKYESKSDTYYDAEDDKAWNEIYLHAIPNFAESCRTYLKEDLKTFNFPSIYQSFAEALGQMFSDMSLNQLVLLEAYQSILGCEDFVESYLTILQTLKQNYIYIRGDEEKKKFKEIRKLIFSNPSLEVKMEYCRIYKTPEFDFENY